MGQKLSCSERIQFLAIHKFLDILLITQVLLIWLYSKSLGEKVGCKKLRYSQTFEYFFLEWKEKTFAFSQVKFLTLKLGPLTQAMRLLMLTQVLRLLL